MVAVSLLTRIDSSTLRFSIAALKLCLMLVSSCTFAPLSKSNLLYSVRFDLVDLLLWLGWEATTPTLVFDEVWAAHSILNTMYVKKGLTRLNVFVHRVSVIKDCSDFGLVKVPILPLS